MVWDSACSSYPQSWVSLDVVDAEGQVVSSQACHLVMPTSSAISRGAFYSDELRTPTENAHLQPGWGWRIRCHSDEVTPEEPLDPPVPEWRPRDSTPFFIEDPDWLEYQRRQQIMNALTSK